MIWRNPVAWLGLATLLIPLAIHLLVRHRAEPRPFPSLRFVQPTRLASVRRKMISDWPLLVIRLMILALAVAALADPLWQSAARRAEWSERQARAIVVDTTASVTSAGRASTSGTPGAGANTVAAGAGTPGDAAASADGSPDAVQSLVQREVKGAFRAETFAATDVAEGIRRAADWLRTAPPARRELVVISDFRLGALDARMLRDLPAHVGIRLARTSGAPVTRTADGQPRTQRATAGAGAAANGFTLRSPRVVINANETAVTWADAGGSVAIDATASTSEITLRPFDVKLRSTTADRPSLLAAAEAVLAQGVPVTTGAAAPRKSATIIVASGPSGTAAPAPKEAATLSGAWQADIIRAIATDPALTRATGRATTASNDAATPWIVLMRDADGKPAILAAADGARASERMLVWSRIAAGDETTALLIRATLRALAGADAFGEAEVIAIPDATLAQWQRPASDPPASEWRDVDGNDRRWLWGAAIALLIVEQVLRRRARHREAQPDRPDGKVFEHAA